ncbi:MAG: hypothetical protein SFW62_07505 [Alphaproteobacteria bacterium]|nr:hypothetical protein [Alphaproteobacteria bacterium]
MAQETSLQIGYWKASLELGRARKDFDELLQRIEMILTCYVGGYLPQVASFVNTVAVNKDQPRNSREAKALRASRDFRERIAAVRDLKRLYVKECEQEGPRPSFPDLPELDVLNQRGNTVSAAATRRATREVRARKMGLLDQYLKTAACLSEESAAVPITFREYADSCVELNKWLSRCPTQGKRVDLILRTFPQLEHYRLAPVS